MKVRITICGGTACYIMGGSELLTMREEFSNDELEFITIDAITCMDMCQKEESKPPYVLLNGELMKNMNLEGILSKVRKLIEE